MTDTMTDNHIHELWARAWTERGARDAGGLTYSEQCDIFLILHEIGNYILDVGRKHSDTSPGQAGGGATPDVEGRHG